MLHWTRALFRDATMYDQLTAEIKRIRSDKSIQSLDEANVKQGVILPVLHALGWNPFNTNEVQPEYPVSGGNVDYALRLDSRNKVFLEAKRPREDLSKHESQLLEYAFKHGVPQAVLTNGLEWWFYRPSAEGDWQERRFCIVKLEIEEIPTTVTLLTCFLSKETVGSGDAVKNADLRLQNLREFKETEQTLPRAWNDIISGPDEILIDLLDEKVEELCGRKAGVDSIKRFLAKLTNPLSAQRTVPPLPAAPRLRKPRAIKQNLEDYRNKQIARFTFNGQTYEVSAWSQLLVTLANLVYKRHRSEFHKALELKGRKHAYFTSTRQGMRSPKQIGNSGYYVETHWSSDNCIRRCNDLLTHFGYNEEDLQIETT